MTKESVHSNNNPKPNSPFCNNNDNSFLFNLLDKDSKDIALKMAKFLKGSSENEKNNDLKA